MYQKFIATGSVHDKNSAPNGRPASVIALETIEQTRVLFTTEQRISIFKAAQRLNISETLCWRILNKKLKLYPYEITLTNFISEPNFVIFQIYYWNL